MRTELQPAWRQNFLSFAQLAEAGVRLSRSQLCRLAQRRQFPKPYMTRTNEALYLASEVAQWVAARRALAAQVAPAAAEAEEEQERAA